jgi:Tfp pilus assembly protein PilZ
VVRIHLGPDQCEDGYLVDLNNAGAFVATSLELEKGTRLAVELQIPGIEEPRPLQAVVARCSPEIRGASKVIPAGMGVAFVGATAEERQLIQQMVTETLAIDLLGYGIERRPTDTIAARPV